MSLASKLFFVRPHSRTLFRGGSQLPLSAMAQAATGRIPNVTNMVDFLHLVQSLKWVQKQPRKGWVLRDVQNPESIADHMYRMSVLALTMAGSQDIDQPRLVKMAIVHDIAEALVGDITPVCGISREEKHKQELSGISEIQELNEYEEGTTAEAKLCKDFDKIEMIMQAYEYEAEQPLDLQEFFDSTAGKWRTALGQSLAEEIIRRRSNQTKK